MAFLYLVDVDTATFAHNWRKPASLQTRDRRVSKDFLGFWEFPEARCQIKNSTQRRKER
jgi:hypothetical protein